MSRSFDVLIVVTRHAESHRASAETDAYSAQEAPRLEEACAAIAEMMETLEYARDWFLQAQQLHHVACAATLAKIEAAIDRAGGTQ